MSTGYVEDVDGQLVPRSEKVIAHDNIVVPAAPVTLALTQFAQQWRAERPSTSTRFGCHHDPDASTTVRVVDYIVERSGVDRDTVQKHLRRRRTGLMSHRLADALLSALDRVDVLDQLPASRAA